LRDFHCLRTSQVGNFHVVYARFNEPQLLRNSLGEIEIPSPYIRPAVVDHDPGGVSLVAYEQLRPERERLVSYGAPVLIEVLACGRR
jgi:hypothetical protein